MIIDDDIKNFLKKLYILYGCGSIPYIIDTPLIDEYNVLSAKEKKFRLMTILVTNEWCTGRVSEGNRKFTQKFIDEIINNDK